MNYFESVRKLLQAKIHISGASILGAAILVFSAIIITPQINAKIECRKVESQYEDSIERVSAIVEKAKNQWESFPESKAQGIWFPESTVRTGDDGSTYFNFANFWESEFEFAHNREMKISSRIVVNNAECFEAREVSEEQEFLED